MGKVQVTDGRTSPLAGQPSSTPPPPPVPNSVSSSRFQSPTAKTNSSTPAWVLAGLLRSGSHAGQPPPPPPRPPQPIPPAYAPALQKQRPPLPTAPRPPSPPPSVGNEPSSSQARLCGESGGGVKLLGKNRETVHVHIEQQAGNRQQRGKQVSEKGWEWQLGPEGDSIWDEEDEDEVQMGFEMMPTPGRKKRPYSVIASVLGNPNASTQPDAHHGGHDERWGQPLQGAEVLKVPVPRFYDLEVGERIIYTTTTLDEEKWEPVESSPQEATVVEIIGREGGATSSVDTSQVSYRVSAAGTDSAAGEDAVVSWAEVAQCWVLRSSPRPCPQSPPPAGGVGGRKGDGRTSTCPEVNNLLDAISAKRSQLWNQ